MAATALEALADVDAAAAADLAEKRFAESLGNDCAPAALVKLLFAQGRDPVPPLRARLEALSCDRKRLRPDHGLLSGEKDVDELRRRGRAAAEGAAGACGKALEELLGSVQSADVE